MNGKVQQVLVVLALTASVDATAAPACAARSAGTVPPVVELYTSEGCSSCPPADHWLSRLKSDPAVVAMAFHVDYWDRLGWKDRFASADYTQRQGQEQQRRGSDYTFTPQVVLDGRDYSQWRSSRTLAPSRPASLVDVAIARDGERYVATITRAAKAPLRLAAYWTVTEQEHSSDVKAGENRGEMLRHDYVVREYVRVPAWNTGSTEKAITFTPAVSRDPGHPRAINLVVLDDNTGQPVQAVRVTC